MSAKAIREATGKDIINRNLKDSGSAPSRFAAVDAKTDWADLLAKHPWLGTEKLVAKPDQLIKRRGKLGLLAVNKSFDEIKKWITERLGAPQKIGEVTGHLKTFIIEPFVPHKQVSVENKYNFEYVPNIVIAHIYLRNELVHNSE